MICWYCGKETEIKDTDYGDHNCPFCKVEISIYNPNEPKLQPADKPKTSFEDYMKTRGDK